LTGTFTGTSTWEIPQDRPCGLLLEEHTGTYDPDRRGVPGGTYTLDVCVAQVVDRLSVDGTFEVSGPRLTLSGTVHGFLSQTDPPSGDLALDLTLSVTDSRAPGRPIRGTITATGTRSTASGSVVLSGTFTADLHRTRR
jgi:hypothetical protein